jgi:hypothetical protein
MNDDSFARKVSKWLVSLSQAVVAPALVIGAAGFVAKSYFDTHTERLKADIARNVTNESQRLETYRALLAVTYDLRIAYKTVSFLLSNDPQPDFQSKIVKAATDLSVAGNALQGFLGKNRPLVPKAIFDSGVRLVDETSGYIDVLKSAMGGTSTPETIDRAGKRVGNTLISLERVLDSYVLKTIPRPD